MRSLVNQSIVSSGIKAPGPIENKIAWLTLLFFFFNNIILRHYIGQEFGFMFKMAGSIQECFYNHTFQKIVISSENYNEDC